MRGQNDKIEQIVVEANELAGFAEITVALKIGEFGNTRDIMETTIVTVCLGERGS